MTQKPEVETLWAILRKARPQARSRAPLCGSHTALKLFPSPCLEIRPSLNLQQFFVCCIFGCSVGHTCKSASSLIPEPGCSASIPSVRALSLRTPLSCMGVATLGILVSLTRQLFGVIFACWFLVFMKKGQC